MICIWLRHMPALTNKRQIELEAGSHAQKDVAVALMKVYLWVFKEHRHLYDRGHRQLFPNG